jgi:hypothetical protein
MRNRQLEAVRVIVATALVAFMLVASAQNVGALRQTSYDLPQTVLDREVLTLFFGAIDAVQRPCSASLTDSLASERALAACAAFDAGNLDLERRRAQLAFESNFDGTPHTWVTPWQEAEGFGNVRRVALAGQEYFLAIDDGLAYVIRFLE